MGDLPRPSNSRAHGPGSPADSAVEERPPRVVLVDCYANSNLFVGDEEFRGLGKRLDADGIDASLLDLVRDESRPGTDVDSVLIALRQAQPTLVVVSRAWSERLIDSIRAVAGGARVVRYSHGAPSPIDASFDAVLDADGVRDLLVGGTATAPRWRRTKAELAVRGPDPTTSTGARPSISGPAHGCPFLVDVRTSPAYRDSGIDYERVQTKGCAFCLDNVGAFAAFPGEEIVGTWLTQLRALRHERPEVREILLTDERPHPYLPAFFRAILEDAALHGIELLMKTRVDWLAEYADTDLRTACDLAEQSGSVLHIYLVGFESFHQPDLDLFNKAVAVADNVRAIETLRALETRHPRSFEFRRLHMHGIILFHPWTTPEALLDNARAMRGVRFHEIRHYALRTRMRLYASVPLHALAARQGLLTEHFDDGRVDRAIEQGYDASVPWRFNDARIEAIFRAANRVADAMPQLHDADVLEMVTRFVLRWPALADRPDLAALPLLQAPFAWGASPADIVDVAGPTLAGFDREVEAVAAGSKAACLKEAVPREDAGSLVAAYAVMGLAAAVVSTHARGGDDGRHRQGDTHVIVAVAPDKETLAQVVAHQRAVERGDSEHIDAMGELMGYPPCCIAAFAARRARGDNLDLERAPLREHPDTALAPLLNRFAAVSLISHLLCSPDCAASQGLARTRLAAITDIDPDAPQRIAAHLASAVLRIDYRLGARLGGGWNGDRYEVGWFRPFINADFGVEPSRVRSIRLNGTAVVFELERGAEHVVAAAAPVIVEPGQVLAPPVRNAIANAKAPAASTARTRDREGASIGAVAAALSPDTIIADYVIAATELDEAGGMRVRLRNAGDILVVRIRPWDPGRPALSRRGPWSLDLEDGVQASEVARRVIGALALLLPAGSHRQGTG